MPEQTSIYDEPTLQTYTSDLGARGRIRDMDSLIDQEPEVFIEACRRLGGEAVQFMAHDEPAPEVDPTKLKTVLAKLNEFLENNDLLHVDFDPDTDTKVYGNPNVQRMITIVQAAKSRVIKQGSKHRVEENPEAPGLRNDLSALKLYLFARRKAEWRQQQLSSEAANTTMGHNGAA